MKLFLAGGVQANLKFRFVQTMKLFLAGQNGRAWCIEEYWKQFLSDQHAIKPEEPFSPYILESFYYADSWTEKHIPMFGAFLLDSGAFTFMQGKRASNLDDYIRRYADFINRNNIDHFFELDIDSIVGYPEVVQIRKKIENLTGKKPIPVWHKSRGKNEFLRMCDQYRYVAIGGIVNKEITPKQYRFFPWFIDQAHQRGCKIHGLGFTNLQGITKYHFDSVDSTSWTTGNRFGAVYKFNGKTMKKFSKKTGQRLADSRATALNNFCEWVKFQQFADKHL